MNIAKILDIRRLSDCYASQPWFYESSAILPSIYQFGDSFVITIFLAKINSPVLYFCMGRKEYQGLTANQKSTSEVTNTVSRLSGSVTRTIAIPRNMLSPACSATPPIL
jgi:hypothetical protein